MPNTMNFMNYLDEVFENVKEAISFVRVEPNDQYRTVLMNKAAMDMSGYTQDVVGKLVSEFASPEGYKAVKKQYETVIRTRNSIEFEHWTTVPLGKQAYSTRLVPVLNALGECSLIVAISDHITPELEREQRLIEAERDITAITQALSQAVIVADKDGVITFVSANASQILGKKLKKDTSLFDLIGEDNKKLIKKHAKPLTGGSSLRLVQPCLGSQKPDGVMMYEVVVDKDSGKYVVTCRPMESLQN